MVMYITEVASKLNSTSFLLYMIEKLKSLNTLRTGSFKLFKRPFPGFLTILTL